MLPTSLDSPLEKKYFLYSQRKRLFLSLFWTLIPFRLMIHSYSKKRQAFLKPPIHKRRNNLNFKAFFTDCILQNAKYGKVQLIQNSFSSKSIATHSRNASHWWSLKLSVSYPYRHRKGFCSSALTVKVGMLCKVSFQALCTANGSTSRVQSSHLLMSSNI